MQYLIIGQILPPAKIIIYNTLEIKPGLRSKKRFIYLTMNSYGFLWWLIDTKVMDVINQFNRRVAGGFDWEVCVVNMKSIDVCSGGYGISQGAATPGGDASLLFGTFLPKTSWKWKKNWTRVGAVVSAPLAPSRSTTGVYRKQPSDDLMWLCDLQLEKLWMKLTWIHHGLKCSQIISTEHQHFVSRYVAMANEYDGPGWQGTWKE